MPRSGRYVQYNIRPRVAQPPAMLHYEVTGDWFLWESKQKRFAEGRGLKTQKFWSKHGELEAEEVKGGSLM